MKISLKHDAKWWITFAIVACLAVVFQVFASFVGAMLIPGVERSAVGIMMHLLRTYVTIGVLFAELFAMKWVCKQIKFKKEMKKRHENT